MSSKRRRIIILLMVVPVVLLAAGVAIYIALQVRHVMRNLDVLLVDEVKRQTNRAVKVGRVDASFLGSATVHNLRLANGDSFDDGTLFQADRVIVRFHWKNLIIGRAPAIQTVESIKIVSPTILIERNKAGRVNIQDLIMPKPGPPRPPFLGHIEVSDGELVFRDRFVQTGSSNPAVTRVVKLEGAFDAAEAPYYVYHFTALGAERRTVSRLSLSGSLDNSKGQMSIDVKANDAVASHWLPYFVKPSVAQMNQGQADINLSATRSKVNDEFSWRYAGSVELRNGNVTAAGLNQPVTDVQMSVRMSDGVFNLDGSAGVAGTQVKLNGKVIGTKDSKLNLQINSDKADFFRLMKLAGIERKLKDANITGSGPLDVHVIGPISEPAVSIRASIPSVTVQDYKASKIDVRAVYAGGTVELQHASADVLGGHLTVSGTVGLDEKSDELKLIGGASKIQLSSVPALRRVNSTGTASARFTLTGTLDDPRLAADVEVSRGTLDNLVFADAAGRFTANKKNVTLQNFAAAVADGVVQLSGGLSSEHVDLAARVVGVDVSKLTSVPGLDNTSGIINFDGNISGPTSALTIAGSVEMFEGGYDRYSFDYAQAKLTSDGESVIIDDAVVRLLPAEFTVRGRIDRIASRSPILALDVDIADAQADRLLTLLGTQEDLTGVVEGHFDLRGEASDLTAEGILTLTDGAVRGYPISKADAAFVFSDQRLRLEDLTARSDGAVLTADGTMDENGGLAFKFEAEGVSLVNLSEYAAPFATLSGTANATGQVGGTLKEPSATLSVVSTDPVINTVQFDRFSTQIDWDGLKLTAFDSSLQLGEKEIEVERTIWNTRAGTLQVDGGIIEDFPYASVYTLVAESPYIDLANAQKLSTTLGRLQKPDTGTVTAGFSASGPLDEIEMNYDVSVKGINIAEIKDATLDFSATSSPEKTVLKKLEAASDALMVSAQGTIYADGRTDLEVDAYNVDLGALTPATGPTHVTGTATVLASIQGPITTPVVTISADIVDPVIYGVELDSLRASQIVLGEDSIDISQVLLRRDNHSASFFGTLPWDWSELTIPTDEPIELHAQLDDQTLGMLGALTDIILIDPENPGALSAKLDVTGTINEPNVGGAIRIADGSIGIRGLDTSFLDIQADLVFDGGVLKVETLSGASSDGGTFSAVPGGSIALSNIIGSDSDEPRGMVDLAFRLSDLVIEEANLFGYDERVKAKLATDGVGVRVSGPLTKPLISGTMQIGTASARLGRIPEAQESSEWSPVINPDLNLAFVLQDDIRFEGQGLVALMQGKGNLSGTLKDPKVNSELRIVRGVIDLKTARMRITKGSIIIDWPPPKEGSQTAVNIRELEAQTTVTAASPSGAQKRYTIIMNVEGPLQNLQPDNIQLRSDPPDLSRTQILASLGHLEDIVGSGDLALRIKDAFTLAVSPLLLDPLENVFMEAFGFDEFSIEYGLEQPLAVFLVRDLFNGFYASYWRIVTGEPDSITGTTFSLSIGYKVNDWLKIAYVTDSRRVNMLEASYNSRF